MKPDGRARINPVTAKTDMSRPAPETESPNVHEGGMMGGTLNWLSSAAMLKSSRTARMIQAAAEEPPPCAMMLCEWSW